MNESSVWCDQSIDKQKVEMGVLWMLVCVCQLYRHLLGSALPYKNLFLAHILVLNIDENSTPNTNQQQQVANHFHAMFNSPFYMQYCKSKQLCIFMRTKLCNFLYFTSIVKTNKLQFLFFHSFLHLCHVWNNYGVFVFQEQKHFKVITLKSTHSAAWVWACSV